jgi:small-conductance mechanosensitive channel
MSSATATGNSAAPIHVAPHFHVQGKALVAETIAWFNDNSIQIAIAAAIGAGIVVLLLGLRRVGSKLVDEDAAVTNLRSIVGRICQRTTISFIVLLAIKLVDGFADAPPLLDQVIKFLFTIGFTIQAAFWARELILGFVEYRAGIGDSDHSALGSALGIIRLLVSLTVFSLATVIVLDNLGVNVTGLIAGLGIGGIAIGLAAQGIFKDLFAALAIIFDRPFRRGDSVKWNSISGTVEAIGLKSTRIRAITGEQVIVGNAYLLEKEMYNLARLDRRRITLSIGLTYYTPEDICARVPDMLRKVVGSVPKCQVVRVGMIGFGDSSLDYELQFDVISSIYNEVFDARTKVCLAILKTFNAAGIEFAFPTQTTITADPSGRGMMPYPEAEAMLHHEDAPPPEEEPAREDASAGETAP